MNRPAPSRPSSFSRGRSPISGTLIAGFVALALIGGGAAYLATVGGTGAEARAEADRKLQLASGLLRTGHADKAIAVLDEAAAKGLRLGEEGAWLRVRALDEAGSAGAAEAAKALLKHFPQTTHKAEAELIALRGAIASGSADSTTVSRVSQAIASSPNSPSAARLEAALGLKEVAEGRVREAAARFERLWQTAPDDPQTRALADAISKANLDALMTGGEGITWTEHTVARGEVVFNIAKKHGITPELLLRVNGITDPKRLRVGQVLKVPQLQWSLQCDVGANVLKLYNNGELFRLYPVRTGREAGSTPQGEFRILNKKNAPTWRPGNGHVYRPGDPNNELGTRWMAFDGDILGIHGTIHEGTVGHYASNGCIGMRKADVEELFDLVTVGTPLRIVGSQDTTRAKVIPPPQVPPPQEIASR